MAETLDDLRSAWHAIARYRVVIKEARSDVGSLVAHDLPYGEAVSIWGRESARLLLEHPDKTCWTIPMAFIELENQQETLAAYQRARQGASQEQP